jgi:hypothetical protein
MSASPITINTTWYLNCSTQLNITAGVEIIITEKVDINLEGKLRVEGDSEVPVIFRNFNRDLPLNIGGECGYRNTFEFCEFINISFKFSDTSCSISNSLLINSSIYIDDGNINVENNTFQNSTVGLVNSYGHINYNTWIRNPGIARVIAAGGFTNSTVNIIGNTLIDIYTCFDASNLCNLKVHNNFFNNTFRALYLLKSDADISRNTILNTEYGIDYTCGDATISKNIIMYGFRGIVIEGCGVNSGKDSRFKITNNIISQNYVNVDISGGLVIMTNNNVSSLPHESPYNHNRSFILDKSNVNVVEYIFNYNIITEIQLAQDLNDVKQNYTRNFWDGGKPDIGGVPGDHSEQADPVLDKKPYIDLS